MKVTKGELTKAVRAAMDASLGTKGAFVKVDHVLFEGYVLRCYKARMYRIQQYPSTIIVLRHETTNRTVWDTQAGYLSACIGNIVRAGAIEAPKAV